ncbi:MAG: glycosyltransferase [Pirellulales bacterium]
MSETSTHASAASHANADGAFPKLLCVAMTVEPTPTAMAFVVKNLLAKIPPERVVIAAERTPANPPSQTHDTNGVRIEFVCRKWTWPKRGLRYVAWLRWLVLPITAWKLARLAKRERVDALFVNFPHEYLLFASYLAAGWTGIPLLPYLHNTYRENRTGLARRLAGWLQPRVFARAATVFTMSRGMNELLEPMYPGVRFRPIPHTFAGDVPPFEEPPVVDPRDVRLGFMGSINESNLEALRRVCETVNARPRFRLTFFSNSPVWFCKKEGLVGPRIDYETPGDDELLERMRSCDLLVLPHGFTGGFSAAEYATIFPTRTVLYFLSRRPSLVHAPTDCFYTRWIAERDCAAIVDRPDATALGDALERLADDPTERSRLVAQGLSAVRSFQIDEVMSVFASDLRDALAKTS